MPQGKPAGVRCIHLDELERCRLYGRPERPAVCASLKASPEMCGNNREEAMQRLSTLEELTRPDAPSVRMLRGNRG
jgi:hypothetical protein